MMNNEGHDPEYDEDQQLTINELRREPSFTNKFFEFYEGTDDYEWRDN